MQRVSSFGVERKKFSTKTLVKISILSVMAYILIALEFPLPIFPGFLKIDLSDVPALIGAFAMGPVAGTLIVLIKAFLHFITKTQTGGVGEFANFIIGASYIIPASIIYNYKKDKMHAIIGVAVGTIAMCIVGVMANIYIIIPFYSKLFPLEAIIGMGTAVNSRIVDLNTLVLYGITPFNILKGFLIGIITMLVYKKIAPLLKNN